MQIPPDIKWLFLDLNSYFASVEQQENPALRGQPVAVVPVMSDATCAIAASYEAKAYGIKTGTKIWEARKRCPQLRCVLARHDKYVDYHNRIMEEVTNHIAIHKICSIDELSSRLPDHLCNTEAACALVRQIKTGLQRHVGEAIKCSVGLAPNSFLAKVASDMQKPDGLTVLEPRILPGPLFDLKLTDLPGINVNMERRLARAGITSIEKLWHIAPKHARQIWGSVNGERFWYNLHGYEIPDQPGNTSVIGHSRVLDPDLRRPAEARLITRRLTIKACSRLRRKGFYATLFSLGVRAVDDNRRWEAHTRLSPSQDNFSFLHRLDDLWAQMLGDLRPQRLRKVSITLSGLCRPEEITPDLFDSASEASRKLTRRYEAISGLMDKINSRYGRETIRLGITPQTRAGHVGTKIAFARIPDKAEFYE